MTTDHQQSRELTFEGAVNVRDLGGISTCSGKQTKSGFLLRSDSIENFTERDWEKLVDYGIRTVLDLRFKTEIKGDLVARPEEIRTVNISLDGGDDPDFWRQWRSEGKWATPLYYKAHLKRFPEITASVISEIVKDSTGGVLFHCASGRDRTGLIALVLLHLAGVANQEIANDHSLSHDNLSVLYASRNETDQRIFIEKLLKIEGKNTFDIFDDLTKSIDIKELLFKNGLSQEQVNKLKKRLL